VGSSPTTLGLALYSRRPARRWEAEVNQNSLCPFCVASKGAARGKVSINIPLAIRLVTRELRPSARVSLSATPGVFALASSTGVALAWGWTAQTVAEGSA